jgi:hypothetical protein
VARTPKAPRRNPVFTEFKRAKLLRKRIPLAEAGSGLAVLIFLLLAGGWVHAQRNNYDPGERDLDMALFEGREPPEDLYNTPVEFWREPGTDAAPAGGPDLGPFPASLVAAGWKAGRLQRFTPDTLYEKINGQAEQYVKFGFRELHVLPLAHRGAGATLDLFLYEQGSFADALGLYAEQRGAKESRTAGALRYTPTAAGAFGAVGPFVFHLIGAPDGEALRGQTEAALQALSEMGGQVDAPRPYGLLAGGLGLAPESIGYTPVNAFQLSFAKDFWFGTLPASATTRAFVHEAESGADAAALLDRLAAEQAAELEETGREAGLVTLEHRYLGTHYAMAVEGATLFGIEDHPDAAALAGAMARMRGALQRPDVELASPPLARSAAPPAAPESTGTEDDSEDYSEEDL